ncbi:MAG: AAA family ATPase [Lentisphaerae bacterium]|nr:AAA family ATPase [Lentisphaerota bacterium]
MTPTKSAIFTGEPGVGKTLAARSIASKLGVPLLILDLTAVMSSFLGRTGVNVRHVFNYAKGLDCVLLLDEFDAIGKRRDDSTEVGELKRLVTALLQEIDDWPPASLLIAATNHPGLLDPAIWRRFDQCIQFPMPSTAQLRQAVDVFLPGEDDVPDPMRDVLAASLAGSSFSDVERALLQVHRNAVVNEISIEQMILDWLTARTASLPLADKKQMALEMMKAGRSQRQASEWTGLSRDTIRKAVRAQSRGQD